MVLVTKPRFALQSINSWEQSIDHVHPESGIKTYCVLVIPIALEGQLSKSPQSRKFKIQKFGSEPTSVVSEEPPRLGRTYVIEKRHGHHECIKDSGRRHVIACDHCSKIAPPSHYNSGASSCAAFWHHAIRRETKAFRGISSMG